MNDTICIEVAKIEDAKELLRIYAPYVTDTAITFEYEVPTVEEFQGRIKRTLENYPYLVARQNGTIVGYAYTSAFKERAAYDWSVETSIYVDRQKTKLGIGKKLYEALENISKKQNILNLNACIGCPKVADEHLDNNSVQFHAHMGYEMVGMFHNCGYKFGTWYHMVWMEKMLGEHEQHPKEVVPFSKLNWEI